MSENLPCGPVMLRYADADFKLITKATALLNSKIGIRYARFLEHTRKSKIVHAGNSSREVRLSGRYCIDAYEVETGSAFDLHG